MEVRDNSWFNNGGMCPVAVLTEVMHVCAFRDREMEKTFEVVKHRNRGREETGGTASMQQLQLDNQYAILGDK